MSSPLDQLFENRYWMQVEERAFHSPEEIKEIGIFGVHSTEEAENHLSTLRPVRITIIDLAYYYDRGFKLKFTNLTDVHEMFKLIDTHLNNWLRVCNTHGFIPDIPPIEDFELLDNLAEKLYPYANKQTALSQWRSNSNGLLMKSQPVQPSSVAYNRYSPQLYKYCVMVHGEE